MFTKLKNRTKGFTIIEVLIVLAIAALILLIVFLAVPALQRNSRNTQRRTDAANIASALANFAGNNGGSQPTQLGYVTADTTTLSLTCDGAAVPATVTITNMDDVTAANAPSANCATTNTNKEETKLGYVLASGVAGSVNGVRIHGFSGGAATVPSIVAPTANCTDTNINTNCVLIYLGYSCNTSNPTAVPGPSARSYAVYYVNETGSGNGSLACTG